jgi:hypothetical protein
MAEGTIVGVHYDASGSDRTMVTGGQDWLADGSQYTQTDSTLNYSIRANTIS